MLNERKTILTQMLDYIRNSTHLSIINRVVTYVRWTYFYISYTLCIQNFVSYIQTQFHLHSITNTDSCTSDQSTLKLWVGKVSSIRASYFKFVYHNLIYNYLLNVVLVKGIITKLLSHWYLWIILLKFIFFWKKSYHQIAAIKFFLSDLSVN